MAAVFENKKIALVHDYLLRLGGAERVLKVLHEIFPQAPIYTVLYDEKFVREFLPGSKIHGSFLHKLPLFLRQRYKYLLPLIPSAVENIDLSDFDIIISSCSAFCKGVITRPDAAHICYCHTPTRFLWDWTHEYAKPSLGMFTKILLHFLRFWDKQAAGRVDYFIANSKHVATRIGKYYRREAVVIYPPVDVNQIGNGTSAHEGMGIQDFYLIVSQLRPYKQIDIALEAFKKLGYNLIIIGQGDDRKRLEKIANGAPNIKFWGFLPDEEVFWYYTNCKAVIFPGEEDFGITMVEAMLAGKPVLALRAGGAKEIVIEGITGEFFDNAHPLVLADGLRRLLANYSNYSPKVIKSRAERFSRIKFEKLLLDYAEKCCRMKS